MSLSTFDTFKMIDSEDYAEVSGEKLRDFQGAPPRMLRDVGRVRAEHGICNMTERSQ